MGFHEQGRRKIVDGIAAQHQSAVRFLASAEVKEIGVLPERIRYMIGHVLHDGRRYDDDMMEIFSRAQHGFHQLPSPDGELILLNTGY